MRACLAPPEHNGPLERFTDLFITGGAGFIGSHLAREGARRGLRVTIYDNLSRLGTRDNLAMLKEAVPSLRVVEGDIRDARALSEAVAGMPKEGRTALFHEASQVAVTTSVIDPRNDFEINAAGTFNVLEAIRAHDRDIPVLFASTNKVYGHMEGVGTELREDLGGYAYAGGVAGIPETTQLDFHSPYGCSKGAADQYVRDYARIYSIPTVVFRQSCIYGTHQFGVEDQGWVAWFVIAAELGRPVTIFGDGWQVRDVLWVDDLVGAYFAALERIGACAGSILNIGGGPANRLSLRGLLSFIESETGTRMEPAFADWRPGDQRVYVSDISRACGLLGWAPRVGPAEGIRRLAAWVRENRALIVRLLGGAQHDNIVARAREAARKG